MDKYAYEVGARAALLDLGILPPAQKTASPIPIPGMVQGLGRAAASEHLIPSLMGAGLGAAGGGMAGGFSDHPVLGGFGGAVAGGALGGLAGRFGPGAVQRLRQALQQRQAAQALSAFERAQAGGAAAGMGSVPSMLESELLSAGQAGAGAPTSAGAAMPPGFPGGSYM